MHPPEKSLAQMRNATLDENVRAALLSGDRRRNRRSEIAAGDSGSHSPVLVKGTLHVQRVLRGLIAPN